MRKMGTNSHIHEYCKECRTYLSRDWYSENYDCRFADVCNERKRYLALVNNYQAKAVEAFKRMCPFQDGRCRPNCKDCARLNQFVKKLNE